MILRRIWAPFREFGFAGALYCIDRALRSISSELGVFVYEFMVQPIPDEPARLPRSRKSVEIRELDRESPEYARMPAPREIIDFRLSQDAVCLGAFKKEKLIGYMWLCTGTYDEDQVRCTYTLSPENSSVFDFDFYLFPEHRMGFGFVLLWEGANNYLRERGIRRSFSRLTRFNTVSRNSHAHFGWQRVGQSVFFKFWNVLVMVASVAPYVALSTNRSTRIKLNLHSTINSKERNSVSDETAMR